MDQEWATTQLEEFIGALDQIESLGRIGHVIAEDEGQMLRLEDEVQKNDNTARTGEPIVQMIMESVEPGLAGYRMQRLYGDALTEHRDWEPAKQAALRALGLVLRGAEAKERLRSDAPSVAADQLHDWVWSAARPMWEAGSYSTAVLHAAQSVNVHLQQKLGRTDTGESALCTEAFSPDHPRPGRPRLRFGGDRSSQTWRSLQDGAGAFGRGCFQAMRNPPAHSYQHSLTAQEALEELAALSRLARWIERCEVERSESEPVGGE